MNRYHEPELCASCLCSAVSNLSISYHRRVISYLIYSTVYILLIEDNSVCININYKLTNESRIALNKCE